MLFIFLLVLCAVKIDGATEGDLCHSNGSTGVCKDVRNCSTAIQDIKNHKYPKICGFNKNDPVVCCITGQSSTAPDQPSTIAPVQPPTTAPNQPYTPGPDQPSTTESDQRSTKEPDQQFPTTKRSVPTTSTTQFVSSVTNFDKYSEQNLVEGLDGTQCKQISSQLTANKTGQKAWDKCIEYQELVYPCAKTLSSGGIMLRQNKCHHQVVQYLTPETSYAGTHEYPHAALLGYGDNATKLVWLCGGSLISDRFILTAAHCTLSRSYGAVTYVALNTIDRTDVSPQNIYKISRIINHPEYNPLRRYHDITLLELEKAVHLDSNTVPACLFTGTAEESDANDLVIATTWSTNDILKTGSTVLQKIHLSKFTAEDCLKLYPPSRRGGYNDTTQVCYGDRTQSKKICQDDGGNPIVVENRSIGCMYSVVGVTSYGAGCLSHNPGVYIRVDLETYVPWIESIVWP